MLKFKNIWIKRHEPVPSSLTLVDMSPPPEYVYIALESLYNDEMHYPEEVGEAIRYFEGRLMDLNLPVDRDTYELTIKSPEPTQYERLTQARDCVEETPSLLVTHGD
jgi:hypothetical protein